MNWLDNIIAFISPRMGAEREAWRNSLEEARNYDAGDYGRLNSGWRAYNESAEMTDRSSRDAVRARARDLERNSDIMNSMVGPYKRNIVGLGFVLQAKTPKHTLNENLESAWKRWCKARNCDVTATQGFNQMLRMAVERKKVDGGILFAKRYTDDGFLPFKLQIFEVDELDASQTVAKNAGCRVVGGIEYNQYNRAVGYWIRQYAIDGFNLGEPAYIPEKDMIFYFSKRRPSQIREISDMSQTVTRIRDTNEFMTAVSVKERILACLAVFIKRMYPDGALPGRHTQEGERKSYDGKMITPGMIKELNMGDDVHVVNPSGQSTDATGYIKLQQRMAAAGQGISYEAASRDMSESNYSSARQGMIEDELTYAEEEELLRDAMDEIYETFVISCVLKGVVNIPGFWENKEEYFEHEWVKAPKKWIDPLKEASATKIALTTGQKTFKQIAAENGKDWREQIDEMAEVNEYAKKMGIDLSSVLFGQQQDGKEEKGNDTKPNGAGGGAGPKEAE